MGIAFRLRCILVLLFAGCSASLAATPDKEPANWIWTPVHTAGRVPTGVCYFRRTFELPRPVAAELRIAADDSYEVYVNGKEVGRGTGWASMASLDLSSFLTTGKNTLAIKAVNRKGRTAGLCAEIRFDDGTSIVTDGEWKCSKIALPKWTKARFADQSWKSAAELGRWGTTAPWNTDSIPSPPAC